MAMRNDNMVQSKILSRDGGYYLGLFAELLEIFSYFGSLVLLVGVLFPRYELWFLWDSLYN